MFHISFACRFLLPQNVLKRQSGPCWMFALTLSMPQVNCGNVLISVFLWFLLHGCCFFLCLIVCCVHSFISCDCIQVLRLCGSFQYRSYTFHPYVLVGRPLLLIILEHIELQLHITWYCFMLLFILLFWHKVYIQHLVSHTHRCVCGYFNTVLIWWSSTFNTPTFSSGNFLLPSRWEMKDEESFVRLQNSGYKVKLKWFDDFR